MISKPIFFSAFVQAAFCQCIPAISRAPIGCGGSGLGLAGSGIAGSGFLMSPAPIGYIETGSASTGGGFTVSSASPFAPTGVSVTSENEIEGALNVGGHLPLLGSVGLEGAVPTEGLGAVSYGCGDGATVITEASITPGTFSFAPATGAGLAGSGFGWAGSGFAPRGLSTNHGLSFNGLNRDIHRSCIA